jgi:toxin-antitoxin system PIN domain toxin
VTTFLLDASVLIALTVAEHEHHAKASAWASTIDRFAVCPVVEGALVRFLVRVGESAQAARQLLQAVHSVPGCEFWADSVSYADTDLGRVRGHRQVTDAYLLSLAGSRAAALLATLDVGLAQEWPEHTELIGSL